jgi:cysteinyl-tRNA synthetase
MNITDVDDKIILAARQQYLLSRWLAKHTSLGQSVRDTTTKAYQAYVQKNLDLLQPVPGPEAFDSQVKQAYIHVLEGRSVDGKGAPGDEEAKIKMHLKTAGSAAQVLSSSDQDLDAFAAKASGVLLPYIDSLEKHTIQGKDYDIFTKLTKGYEQRFFNDMKTLNVRYPDKLTRVTEYGPQIVDFVKRVQENGFAYEHEGSVYYDMLAWESTGGVYARLQPENRNDKELQQDGEGSLSTKQIGFKRSAADFALWKASKEGEPSWESPWGQGRPGWHIECSAMASDVLGKQFDIHSGGIDLAFPHHDNELVQSESYWSACGKDSVQWVNYFLHMGHLSIQGSKMSKSLKNFTTIREALEKKQWDPRGLRIVFLLGAWRDGLEITGEVVKAGRSWEEKVDNFFLNVRDAQRRAKTAKSGTDVVTNGVNGLSVDGKPSALAEKLEESKAALHVALCDSFDTPTAMRIISELITTYNSEKEVPTSLAVSIGEWVTEIVNIFGLGAEETKPGVVGWPGLDIPQEAEAYVYPLSQIRDSVRQQAKAGAVDVASLPKPAVPEPDEAAKPYAQALTEFQTKLADLSSQNAAKNQYLAACDHLRDTVLWDLGIYLEDRDGLPALVRPLSQTLQEERANREAATAAKEAAKQKAAAEKAAEEARKLEAGKLSHLEMFRTSEYSAWDEEGMPTADKEGKEVAKSRLKKLRKEWERQKKLHEAWRATQAS